MPFTDRANDGVEGRRVDAIGSAGRPMPAKTLLVLSVGDDGGLSILPSRARGLDTHLRYRILGPLELHRVRRISSDRPR
jgi:hypothetical protein